MSSFVGMELEEQVIDVILVDSRIIEHMQTFNFIMIISMGMTQFDKGIDFYHFFRNSENATRYS